MMTKQAYRQISIELLYKWVKDRPGCANPDCLVCKENKEDEAQYKKILGIKEKTNVSQAW